MPATRSQNRPAAGAGHARDPEPKPPVCRSGPCPRQLRLDRHRSVGGHGPLLRAGQQGVSDGEHTGLQHIRAQAGAVQHLPYGA